MTGAEDRIIAEAAAWHASSESDAMDWDGFTDWLDSDSRHREAYDEVALADSRLQELASGMERPAVADNDLLPDNAVHAVSSVRAVGWWRWAGAAVAAALVAVLAVPQFIAGDPEIYVTSAQSRSIALEDGSHVILAPHSRLAVDDGETRMALSGGAWFDITHDPNRSLTIAAGDLEIRDIGTRFDVQDSAGQVRVAVAEGRVHVGSAILAAPVALQAGQQLIFDPSGAGATVKAVRPGDAGGWRDGKLTFENAPLALVVADLSRYAGVEVAVDGSLRDRTFSGTLIVRDGKATVRDLSQLMGLGVAAGSGGYRLVPAGR